MPLGLVDARPPSDSLGRESCFPKTLQRSPWLSTTLVISRSFYPSQGGCALVRLSNQLMRITLDPLRLSAAQRGRSPRIDHPDPACRPQSPTSKWPGAHLASVPGVSTDQWLAALGGRRRRGALLSWTVRRSPSSCYTDWNGRHPLRAGWSGVRDDLSRREGPAPCSRACARPIIRKGAPALSRPHLRGVTRPT